MSDDLTEAIIGAAIEAHRILGPGLLESIEEALCHELGLQGIAVERQLEVGVIYKGIKIKGQKLDLLVENKVVVEVKSVEALNDVHLAQVLTYLKLSNCKLGMLINFNVSLIKNGIRRVVNNL